VLDVVFEKLPLEKQILYICCRECREIYAVTDNYEVNFHANPMHASVRRRIRERILSDTSLNQWPTSEPQRPD
jgi:hypothetical protein